MLCLVAFVDDDDDADDDDDDDDDDDEEKIAGEAAAAEYELSSGPSACCRSAQRVVSRAPYVSLPPSDEESPWVLRLRKFMLRVSEPEAFMDAGEKNFWRGGSSLCSSQSLTSSAINILL